MGEPGKKKNVDDLIWHTVAAVDADRKRLQVRREGGRGVGGVYVWRRGGRGGNSAVHVYTVAAAAAVCCMWYWWCQ